MKCKGIAEKRGTWYTLIEGGMSSMTDTTHPEPTRADIVAFCEEAWVRFNASQIAKGEPADRNMISKVERARVGGMLLYKVDFRQYYRLLGTEHCIFLYYVLQQSPHTGDLQFVLWDEMGEQAE